MRCIQRHILYVYSLLCLREANVLTVVELRIWTTTVEYGQIITLFFGEHKVITAEQQCLGLILFFFMHLKWLWLLRFFAEML